MRDPPDIGRSRGAGGVALPISLSFPRENVAYIDPLERADLPVRGETDAERK